MFDPYHKWLGIPPELQPPNHYTLLGLQQFEADADVIEAAAERQAAHLHTYKIGPQSGLSQRILNEISKAKICLLDPNSKAQYDAQLRQKLVSLRAPEPPPAGAASTPPSTVSSTRAPLDRITRTPNPPEASWTDSIAPTPASPVVRVQSRIARKKKRSNFGIAVIGGCLAVIAAIVVIAFAFVEPKQNVSQLSGQPATKNAPSTTVSPKHQRLLKAGNPAVASTADTDSPVATGSKSTHLLPVPSHSAQEAVRKDSFAQMTAEDLLNAANNATDPTTKYVLLDGAIEAAIKQASLQPTESRRLATQAASQLESHFRVSARFNEWVLRRHSEAARSVASSTPDSQQQPGVQQPVPTPAKPQAEPEQETKPSRTASTPISAPTIDLVKAQSSVEITIAEEFKPIEPRQLQLEAIRIDGANFVKRLPSDGRAAHGEPVNLVVRDELPRAGIELTLVGGSELQVRVKPMFQDYDQKLYPWTQDRMKTLRAVLVREIRKCESGIRATENRIPSLAATIEGIRRQSRNAYNERALAAAQAEAEAALANAKGQLAGLRERLPVLHQQSEGFGELFELSEQTHRNGQVHFRILKKVGDEEIVIAQTEVAPVADATSASDQGH